MDTINITEHSRLKPVPADENGQAHMREIKSIHIAEDAVLHEAARHAGIQAIVTRDASGFKQARLATCFPQELAQMHAVGSLPGSLKESLPSKEHSAHITEAFFGSNNLKRKWKSTEIVKSPLISAEIIGRGIIFFIKDFCLKTS